MTGSLRSNQGHRSDQSGVCHEIAMQQMPLGVCSQSAALVDSYAAHRNYLEEIRARFSYVEGARGVLVETAGEMLVLDLFDQAETCRRMWDRLVRAAAIDELAPVRSKPKPWHVQEILRGRLERLQDLEWRATKPIGEGEESRAVDDDSAAKVLLLGGALVHGSAVIN